MKMRYLAVALMLTALRMHANPVLQDFQIVNTTIAGQSGLFTSLGQPSMPITLLLNTDLATAAAYTPTDDLTIGQTFAGVAYDLPTIIQYGRYAVMDGSDVATAGYTEIAQLIALATDTTPDNQTLVAIQQDIFNAFNPNLYAQTPLMAAELSASADEDTSAVRFIEPRDSFVTDEFVLDENACATPEPLTIGLAGIGLMGAAICRRRPKARTGQNRAARM